MLVGGGGREGARCPGVSSAFRQSFGGRARHERTLCHGDRAVSGEHGRGVESRGITVPEDDVELSKAYARDVRSGRFGLRFPLRILR